jgi:hypothetical protein
VVELDHLFVWTSVGAPEAERLIAFGLTEGSPNVHAGQGTANRRFFFHNAMLELLWVQNAREAQSEAIRPTHVWERWSRRTTGGCPFGFCFRSTGSVQKPPFPTWEYRPPYLPEPHAMLIGANAEIVAEPFLVYIPGGRRPDAVPPPQRQPLDHPAGVREITRLQLASPQSRPRSPAFRATVDSGVLRLVAGADYLLKLGFDGEIMGRTTDFRPALPLVLCS